MKTETLKPPPLVYTPPQDPLKILYQDSDIMAFSKPSGLLSVPGKALEHRDCLETRIKDEFPNALLIHRLDRETSGVFIMAMNKPAQANINLQFEKRRTEKHYIAHVWGDLEGEGGHVDLPLCADWENRPRQMVSYDHGRASQTDWTVINRGILPCGNPFTIVSLKPITGRSHQLRVHMASLGHPIIGDTFYAPKTAQKAAKRLLLHAKSLTLTHPRTGETINFDDPCPF